MSERLLSPVVPPLLELEAGNEEELISGMLERLRGHPVVLDFEAFGRAVRERQRIDPPVLECGVALPHARCTAVSELVMAAGRLREPLWLGGVEVKLVFLFGVPPHEVASYLALTARLVKQLKRSDVMEGLLSATSAEAFVSILNV